MIDTQTERIIAIKDAPKEIPCRPAVSTVWRWISNGVRGHKLDTVTIGGRRYTSQEAIERFIEQGTAAANGEPVHTRTAKQRARAIAQAERELAAAGI